MPTGQDVVELFRGQPEELKSLMTDMKYMSTNVATNA